VLASPNELSEMCTPSGRQVAAAINFISGSSLWNLLHIPILEPRILTWLLDFWKIFAPLTQVVFETEYPDIDTYGRTRHLPVHSG
jgi:hypothetical protein